MKNKKSKIIAFVLIFALLITTVIVTSVANAKTTDIQIIADKETILAGESAKISVEVTTNYPVATMSIPVFYDKTLVDVSDVTTTLTEYAVANTTVDSQSVDKDKVYANTEIDSDKFGFILVTYIAGANTDVAEKIDSVVLTFKITAKADVSGEAIAQVVKESAKIGTNTEGMLYFGAVKSGTKITAIPENVENIGLESAITKLKIVLEEQNIPKVIVSDEADTEIVVITDTYGPADGFDGFICGIDTLGVYDMFTLDEKLDTPAGYIEINTDATGGMEGTGSIVELYNDNGELVASYIFVYFGDVDEDGLLTAGDGALIADYELTLEGLDKEYLLVAADVDGDTLQTAGDGAIVADYELSLDAEGSNYMPQADIAAAYK